MPIYIYQHPETDEYIEVIQKMNDDHVFTDDAGVKWNRVWVTPNAAMDTNANPDSSRQFVDKTKEWSVGEMWDYSAELGEKRKSKRGYDHVGEEHHNKRESEINFYREKNRKKRQKKEDD